MTEVSIASDVSTRVVDVPNTFSLRETCAPVWWVKHRSPRHAWLADSLIVVEMTGDSVVWREVSQPGPEFLHITSPATDETDASWCNRVLGMNSEPPQFSDPVIRRLAETWPGLRPYSDGSLFDGILTAIIGQSVSLASAAAAQHKLAISFNPALQLHGREYYPLPSASQLADASVDHIRASGVTWKRAEAIKHIAREQMAGSLPTDDEARSAPDEVIRALLTLPMVGRWTAESVLLWGIGAPDAHPTNDVALLNAVRRAYDRPEMTFKELDVLSGQWRPGRSIAARLLWTQVLGVPPG